MPIMFVGILDLVSSHSAWVRSISHLLSAEAPSKALKSLPKLVDSIVHITLGLSDQQLVTGLAILITGYTKHCSMKSRHWWIVFDLAFFSSVTHLASLPALRDYLTKYRRFRDLRVFLMLSNYIMLLASAILSFRDYDERTKYCPIQCTFDQIRIKRFGVSPIYTVQMVLLSLVFFWQLVMLYASPKAWRARHIMIVMPQYRGVADSEMDAWEEFLEEQIPNPATNGFSNSSGQAGKGFYSRWHSFHKRNRHRKSYTCLRWVAVMLLSPPAAIVWSFILTMWILGVRRLLWDRQWAIGAENRWSFGQVLPLLLVVLPFFTVVEVFQGESTRTYGILDLPAVDETNNYLFCRKYHAGDVRAYTYQHRKCS
jgi:hypothetical protein